MLLFAGLWTQADKSGNFRWDEDQLELDMMPFIKYHLGTSLEALRKSGFIIRYLGEDEKDYGHIPNFAAHQRFFGTEVTAKPRFPSYSEDRKHQGSSLEVPRIVELGVRSKEKGDKEKVLTPAELIYDFYKDSIKASSRKGDSLKWISKRGAEIGFERLVMSIARYALDCKKKQTEDKFKKDCANFFGEDATYEGFLPDEDFFKSNLSKAKQVLGVENEKPVG